MQFNTPGKYSNMRRQEGLRFQEDIWDLETIDNIKKKLELQRPKIEELFDEEQLDEALLGTLNKTRLFCAELHDKFKKEILDLLATYELENKPIPKKILDFLSAKQLDIPSFKITYGPSAKQFLETHGFKNKADQRKIVLIFQLPKPLAKFWWKNNYKTKKSTIEWGELYKDIMPSVWEVINDYELNKGLNFDRINSFYQHDTEPESYHYLWEMSEWSKKDKTTMDDLIK